MDRIMSSGRLSHIDAGGSARMVDVGGKEPTERVARARGRVRMSAATARAVRSGDSPKGEVLGTARLAGIQAAKRTHELIPLAHPIALTFVDVSARVDVEDGLVELVSEVRTVARTGVEMEALTACSVAGLTVYDMVKGLERGIRIEEVVLVEKRGGRSDYVLQQDDSGPTSGGRGDDGHPDRADDARREGEDPPGAAVITISTSKSAGQGRDESGVRLGELAERLGARVIAREVVPDDRALIEARLRHWSDVERCPLVLTTGGTGLAPSDVTPEATAAVIDRDAPGIAEAMRAASRAHTAHWLLSRGRAGVRGNTLIVNFPGSPASIDQAGNALVESLPHALDLIAGRSTRH